jgi:molecular chaperone GrpE
MSAEKTLERLKEEAKQAQEKYLRLLADYENAKKRLQREKDEFARYASETLIRELLPVLDSLDQALVAVDPSTPPAEAGLARDSAPSGLRRQPDMEAIVKGVHLIHRQLLGLLRKEGVVRIPTVGEPFDPHKHEAVAQLDVTDGTPDETVVEEVQVGYTMHGKVIRPAMVKVAKSRLGTGDLRPETSAEPPGQPGTTH